MGQPQEPLPFGRQKPREGEAFWQPKAREGEALGCQMKKPLALSQGSWPAKEEGFLAAPPHPTPKKPKPSPMGVEPMTSRFFRLRRATAASRFFACGGPRLLNSVILCVVRRGPVLIREPHIWISTANVGSSRVYIGARWLSPLNHIWGDIVITSGQIQS